ncbi:hypothetical protein KIH39_05140 [Telmatocola sphagniphila]|uniref:Response regulatory domain-containing protein n=1 Tax=Telmatocola sphagniphila TaxID=1123043 RepID=A0A8E6B8H2_9BACT|nr:hypothetical protein [Telmatocola sphagniphila]QVL33302.1 hypothetical protein KIH39_05140 [Telmatocola sphagniphila]
MRSRILLALADPFLTAGYKAFLLAERHEVLIAGNALDCLDALRDRSPLVLVLDHDLLWGSGEGILSLMKEENEIPSIPVLILTSHPSELTEELLPFSDYAIMIKPLAPGVLVDVVRNLVDHARYEMGVSIR